MRGCMLLGHKWEYPYKIGSDSTTLASQPINWFGSPPFLLGVWIQRASSNKRCARCGKYETRGNS